MSKEFGDRLRMLLETENLSPSQFSEVLGVNRSAVSHLVNNRNKPGYDIITKMRVHFPDWDFDWLIFDISGKTSRKTSSAEIRANTKPKNQETIPGQRATEPPQSDISAPKQEYQASLFDSNSQAQQASNPPQVSVQKHVTKTILIYSDGTFEIYTNNFPT